MLGNHSANRSYRWPLAIRRDVLDHLAGLPQLKPVAECIRTWGFERDSQVFFADLFALEQVLGPPASRVDVMQHLLTVDTAFASPTFDGGDAAQPEQDFYWQARGRSRAMSSILTSTRRLDGHERLDVAHLLPRLSRSLLHTFPPDFGAMENPRSKTQS